MKKDPRVVLAYSRVSRVNGRRGDGFISFEDQEEGIAGRCGALGLHVPDDGWYREPDASGGSFQNRPQWDAMMARLKDPFDAASGFVSVRTDRFSRSVAEGATVAQDLRRDGLNFVLVDVPVDFSTPEGELMFHQMLAYGNYQLSYLRSSWWRSKRRAINRGAHIGRTPHGFLRIERNAERDSGKLVPLDEWKGVIRVLYRFADENPHLRDGAIATWANENNPRPDGRRWYPGMVERMLANPVYIGHVSYKPSGNAEVVWPYDPLGNEAAHEPVVDEGIFLRLQLRRLGQRQFASQLDTQRPRTKAGESKDPALLQGIVRCAGCQHLLKPSMGGVGVMTYHCDGGQHRSSGVCPKGHRATINRSRIDAYVTGVVDEQLSVLVRARVVSKGSSVDVSDLHTAVTEAEEEAELIRENTTMAARSYEQWQSMLDKAEARSRAARAARDEALAEATVEDPQALYRRWTSEDLTVAERREIIAAAIDCVFVRSGRGMTPDARSLILWAGQAAELELDLPRKGRPAKGPAVPLDFDEVMARIAPA